MKGSTSPLQSPRNITSVVNPLLAAASTGTSSEEGNNRHRRTVSHDSGGSPSASPRNKMMTRPSSRIGSASTDVEMTSLKGHERNDSNNSPGSRTSSRDGNSNSVDKFRGAAHATGAALLHRKSIAVGHPNVKLSGKWSATSVNDSDIPLEPGDDESQLHIPAGFLLTMLYKLESRRKITELLYYAGYFAVYNLLTTSLVGSYSSNGIKNSIESKMCLLQASAYKQDEYRYSQRACADHAFYDIKTGDDWYGWMRSTLVTAFNDSAAAHDRNSNVNVPRGGLATTIVEGLELLTSIQVKQVRIKTGGGTKDDCGGVFLSNDIGRYPSRRDIRNNVDADPNWVSQKCYGQFEMGLMDKVNFTGRSGTDYVYEEGEKDFSPLYTDGFYDYIYYGTGGHTSYFFKPGDKTLALQLRQLETMEGDGWISEATRAVSVRLAFYSKNSEMLSTVQVVMEVSNTGGTVQSHKVISHVYSVMDYKASDTAKVLGYNLEGAPRTVLYAFLFTFWVGQLINELMSYFPDFYDLFVCDEKRRARMRTDSGHCCSLERMWFKFHSSFFSRVTSLLQLIFIMGFSLTLYLWSNSPVKDTLKLHVQGHCKPTQENHFCFIDVFSWSKSWDTILLFAAFNYCLFAVQLLARISMSTKISIIILTLKQSVEDLAYVMFLFVVAWTVFGLSANTIYGDTVDGYNSVPNSMVRVFWSFLCIFYYEDLAQKRPLETPIYVVYYNFMMYVVLNIFVAILLKNFDEVCKKADREDQMVSRTLINWGELYNRVSVQWMRIFRSCLSKKIRRNYQWRQQHLAEQHKAMTVLGDIQQRFKRFSEIDLIEFISPLYTAVNRRLTTITLTELCELFNVSKGLATDEGVPCDHNGAHCDARILIEGSHIGYRENKIVIRPKFKTETFNLIHTHEEADNFFPVDHIIRDNPGVANDVVVQRCLFFDQKEGVLFDYDIDMKLKSKWTLDEIVQIERLQCEHDNECIIVFRNKVYAAAFPSKDSLHSFIYKVIEHGLVEGGESEGSAARQTLLSRKIVSPDETAAGSNSAVYKMDSNKELAPKRKHFHRFQGNLSSSNVLNYTDRKDNTCSLICSKKNKPRRRSSMMTKESSSVTARGGGSGSSAKPSEV